MTEKNDPMYLIQLEDYSKERFSSALRTYAGSRQDLMDFAQHLANNPDTAVRYHETIEGIDLYDLNPGLIHTMAGQEIPVMTPAIELARRHLDIGPRNWFHELENASEYYLYCTDCQMDCLLLETPREILEFARLDMTDVAAVVLDLEISDWDCDDCFPGVCTQDGLVKHMRLYTQINRYPLTTKELRLKDFEAPIRNMNGYLEAMQTYFPEVYSRIHLFNNY